jgi:hypothetical protein
VDSFIEENFAFSLEPDPTAGLRKSEQTNNLCYSFEIRSFQVAADGAAHPILTACLCVAVAAIQDTNWHYGGSLATTC